MDLFSCYTFTRLERSPTRIKETTCFIRNGYFPYGRNDFSYLCSTYSSKCISISTSSLVVLIPIRYWTNYLFYNSIINFKRKNLCYAILDRFICRNCCCCFNLSSCRNYSNSLCNDSIWISLNLLFIPTYL